MSLREQLLALKAGHQITVNAINVLLAQDFPSEREAPAAKDSPAGAAPAGAVYGPCSAIPVKRRVPTRKAPAKARSAIVEGIEKCPAQFKTTELQSRVPDMSPRLVNQACARFVRQGRLARVSYGVYRKIEKGGATAPNKVEESYRKLCAEILPKGVE